MSVSIAPNAFGIAALTWVGLSTVSAVLVAWLLLASKARSFGVQRRELFGIYIGAILCGVVGARAFHVADYVDFYAGAPFQMLYLWNGGLSLWGAVALGLGFAFYRARRQGLSVSAIGDAVAVPGMVGLAIGRVADTLVGERAGTESSLPWSIVYSNPDSRAFAEGMAVHPVALYEMTLDLVILAVLLRTRRRGGPGTAIKFALGAWALGRFLIGFVTLNPEYLGLQQAQWVGLAVVACLGIYTWISRRRERPGYRYRGNP